MLKLSRHERKPTSFRTKIVIKSQLVHVIDKLLRLLEII